MTNNLDGGDMSKGPKANAPQWNQCAGAIISYVESCVGAQDSLAFFGLLSFPLARLLSCASAASSLGRLDFVRNGLSGGLNPHHVDNGGAGSAT